MNFAKFLRTPLLTEQVWRTASVKDVLWNPALYLHLAFLLLGLYHN